MKKLYYLFEYFNNPNINHWKYYRRLDLLDPIYLVLDTKYRVLMRRYASKVFSFGHVIYEIMGKLKMSCQESNVFLEISDQKEESYFARFEKNYLNYYECVEFLKEQPTDPRMKSIYGGQDILDSFNGYPKSICVNLLTSVNQEYCEKELRDIKEYLLHMSNEHDNDFEEVISFDDLSNIGEDEPSN